MGQNEARIKLSVDTSQAQRQVGDLNKRLQEVGSGPSSPVQQAMGGSQYGSETSAENVVNSQKKMINSFEDYLSSAEKSNEKLVSALGSIEKYLRGTGDSGGNGGSGGGSNRGNKGDGNNQSGGDKSLMSSLSKTLFSLQTISNAVSTTISYVKNGAASAQSNEMAAYKAYGTLGIYDNYRIARNETAELGLQLGYKSAESIAVANALTSGTGNSDKESLQEDISSILRGSRGLNIDESALSYSASGFYQSGTYDHGQMDQFTNLVGTLVSESGMVGREDESLEVLNAIKDSLQENLTTINQNQYESTLGLYALMTEYNSNFKGANGSKYIQSLNSGITGGGPSMDIALGWGTKYQGWGGYWELAQQKEKGLGDENNLKSILETFNSYSSYDVGSEEYMGQLYKYMSTNFGANTEFTKFISDNMDQILSGNYSKEFSESLKTYEETGTIDQNVENYLDTSLATKNELDARAANAAEQSASYLEDSIGWLQKIYNSMPVGLQAGVSIGGKVLGTAAQGAGSYMAFKGMSKLTSGLFGKSSGTATAGFANSVDDIVDAVNSGENIDDLLKPFAKKGKVTDEMYDWVDEVVDAYNLHPESIDDVLNQGYSKFGKTFTKNTKSSGNFFKNLFNKSDDATNVMDSVGDGLKATDSVGDGLKATDSVGDGLKAADSVVDGLKAADSVGDGLKGAGNAAWSIGKVGNVLNKAGKVAGVVGTVVEVGTTAYDASQAYNEGDYKGVAEEVGEGAGSIGGGWAGGALGAKAGAAIGTLIAPGVGTAIGAALGGIIGGIGGAFAGEKIGGAAGGLAYDAFSGEPDHTPQIRVQEELDDSILDLTEEVSMMRKWLETNGYTGVAALNDQGVKTQFEKSTGKKSWWDFITGSHATGNDYIPYDGYIAELHKGEAVLDKVSADEYRSGSLSNNSTGVLEIRISGYIDGMTPENQNQIVKAVISQITQRNNTMLMMNQLSNNMIRVAN